jgi:Uncharacterized protein conserved in bacteria
MKSVWGNILLPNTISTKEAPRVVVEVRDTSVADAPSTVVAEQRMDNVPLAPGGAIPFRLELPESQENRHLSLRVHVDVSGSGSVSSGDLLTVQSYPVKSGQDTGPMDIKPVLV